MHDFRHFLLVCLLAAIALGATIFLFREHAKKPAFAAPVEKRIEETSTGENYYENERKTN